MNIPRKAILSLLISILLFAAFTVLAYTGLFDLVETRLYNPQVVESLNREIQDDTQSIDALLADLDNRFAATLKEGAVQRSFLPTQVGGDIYERSRIYGVLMNSQPGLQTVRFVDAGGARLHFSTLEDDVLRQDSTSLSYRNYRDCPEVLPYQEVETEEGAGSRLIFDGARERLIFSYPFTDSLDVYRGSALFTFSVRGVAQYLVRAGRIKIGEDLSIVSSPGGFLLGLPYTGRINLKNEVASIWREGILSLSSLDVAGSGALALLSNRTSGQRTGIFVGHLVPESLFVFPSVMKFILLGSFLLTVFLIVFLIFNLRQDNITVIQNRLKRLQTALIQQLYEHKGDMDWKHWSRELSQRREEIRDEVKRGLPRTTKNTKATSQAAADIDLLIDRSWDDLITLIGGHAPAELDEEKLRALITRLLPASGDRPAAPAAGTALAEDTSEVLEELESLEEVPETGEAGKIEEAAPAEVLEELPQAEPAEELEELPQADDEAEPVKELNTEAETAEIEPEVLEVVEELEELEELESEAPTVETGETIVTPAAFEADDEAEAELEPLEEAPSAPSGPIMSREALDELASQIEFGTTGEGADDAEDLDVDVSSPFSALSFGSPEFSATDGDDAEEPDAGDIKKKRQPEIAKDDSGLLEITEDGGLPFIYPPFLFQGNDKPLVLRPEPNSEPIQEQDGVHHINSDILDPTEESTQRLDPKFLNLVESIIGSHKEG